MLHLPTRISARSCPQVRQYFEQIVETAWSDRPYREERLSALFSLLALSLADAREAGDPGLAERIIQLIHAQPHRQFRVAEVASLLYVSPRTVENAMRRAVGTSFSKYQMNRKLEMAAQQISVEPDVRLARNRRHAGLLRRVSPEQGL